jgi:glutaredoxin
MRLYTVPDCESCKQVVSFIQENDKKVDIVELKKVENKWYELIDGHMIAADEHLSSFPALFVGSKEKTNFYVFGDKGCINYIEKGFLHDVKICPYLNKDCIEKKCEKFVLMNKGLIVEGGCADTWTPILMTEFISGAK